MCLEDRVLEGLRSRFYANASGHGGLLRNIDKDEITEVKRTFDAYAHIDSHRQGKKKVQACPASYRNSLTISSLEEETILQLYAFAISWGHYRLLYFDALEVVSLPCIFPLSRRFTHGRLQCLSTSDRLPSS